MSLRIAAGLLIATGITGVVTLLVPRESAAYVTLAEVQATVERTRTLTCTMTDVTSTPDKKESELHRLLTRGPSLVRLENADHTYTITDFERHKATHGRSREEVGPGLGGVGHPLWCSCDQLL